MAFSRGCWLLLQMPFRFGACRVRIFSAASTDSTKTPSMLPSDEVGVALVAETLGGVARFALGSLATTSLLYARKAVVRRSRGLRTRSEGSIVGVVVCAVVVVVERLDGGELWVGRRWMGGLCADEVSRNNFTPNRRMNTFTLNSSQDSFSRTGESSPTYCLRLLIRQNGARKANVGSACRHESTRSIVSKLQKRTLIAFSSWHALSLQNLQSPNQQRQKAGQISVRDTPMGGGIPHPLHPLPISLP